MHTLRKYATAVAAGAALTGLATIASAEQLTIVAELKAKEGKEQALHDALASLVAPTLKDEGVINYTLHVSNADPGFFLFYENWENRELWQAHMETPHLDDFRTKLDDLVAEWTLYEMTQVKQ